MQIWHLAAVLTIVNFELITIYRVKQALEERKREIRGDIEVKDERSRMVNTEKEEIRRLVSQENIVILIIIHTGVRITFLLFLNVTVFIL